MDLALQLSQQEASVAALQMQKREEEDMMKAIQESVSTDLEQQDPLLMGHKQLVFTSEQNTYPQCRFLVTNGSQRNL